MVGDKTLMQDSLTGKDLTEDEARRLANKFEENTAAIVRFEAIEEDLTEIVGVVAKIKKVVIAIIGILFANWVLTLWSSFKAML